MQVLYLILALIASSTAFGEEKIFNSNNTRSDNSRGDNVNGDTSSSDKSNSLVVTASRIPSETNLLSRNINKITTEEIEQVAHIHIQELLQRVPGVNLQRGNGQESLPAIRSPVLTGAGACGGFLMTEDNIPLRAAGFCNVNELFEAHTEQAASIEVIRGPGTAYHGSNALHGIVNVITPEIPDSQQSKLSFITGSYGFSRLKTSIGNSKIDSENVLTGYNIALTVSEDNGYRDDSGYNQQKLTARYLYSAQNLTVNTGMTVTNLDQQTAGFIVGNNSFRDSHLARENLNSEAFRKAESMRLWSRLDYQLTDKDRIVVTPYIRATDMAFRQHFLPGKPLEENGQQSVGFQSAYYSMPTEEFNFSIGLDSEISNGFLKQTQQEATIGSAFLQETIPVGKQYDYDVKASMVAPFINLNWQFLPQWQLSAGIRYEHMNYDYDNQMLAGRTRDDGTDCGFGGCRYSRPEDSKNSFNNWSPKLGISYLLTNNMLVFTNVTNGFRAPQATELYRLQRNQTIAELDSVELNSFETGLRQEHSQFSYEVVYFNMNKDNVIFRDSNFFNLSNGQTKHRGFETSFNYLINKQFKLLANLSIAKHHYASDQFLGEININGNEIDTAPKTFGNTQLRWQPSENLMVEVEWVYQGAYFMDAENLHRYPGHNLVNLRVNWLADDGWKLFARINNLLDKKYAKRADYTFFTEQRYFPGTPLSLFVGFEWRGKK
jgi:iron complex outermembrane receptor protein